MKSFKPFAHILTAVKMLSVALIIFTAVSCEDEPLLEPNTQTSGGGSYKRMTFPDTNQNSIIHYSEKNNPEVF